MAGKTTAPATSDTDPGLVDEAEALFGEGGGGASEDDFADAEDLLNEVEEDDSEGWNPSEKGEGVAGVITKIGETRSDYAKPGEDPMVPTITIDGVHLSPEGGKTEGKYRLIGFGSVLKRELEDGITSGKIAVGNLLAAKYWGEKPIRRGPFAGKNYRHYTVVAQAPKAKKG